MILTEFFARRWFKRLTPCMIRGSMISRRGNILAKIVRIFAVRHDSNGGDVHMD